MTRRNLWIKILLSLGSVALLLLHNFAFSLRPDPVTFILLVILILPWLSDLIKSAEFPGGWKIEFQVQELRKEVVKQEAKLEQQEDTIKQLVIFSLSSACYYHLWHIQNTPEYLYHDEDWFRRQMHFLSDNGYIQPSTEPFLIFDQKLDGKNLVEVAKLTPVGEFLLRLRGIPPEVQRRA